MPDRPLLDAHKVRKVRMASILLEIKPALGPRFLVNFGPGVGPRDSMCRLPEGTAPPLDVHTSSPQRVCFKRVKTVWPKRTAAGRG